MIPYFWMGSLNIDNPVPIKFEDSQFEQGRRFQLGTDYYFSINYDHYRKEYWRVVYKKYDEESIDKMLKRQKGGPNHKSMIIYNENLERIGEFDFKNNWRASGYDLFLLTDGAYISSTPDSIEDQMIFRKLILE